MIEGQLCEISFHDGNKSADWEYYVIKHIYDDRIHMIGENYGRNFMYVLANKAEEHEVNIVRNQSIKTVVSPLFKNGLPVMSGKTWKGRYTFSPAMS